MGPIGGIEPPDRQQERPKRRCSREEAGCFPEPISVLAACAAAMLGVDRGARPSFRRRRQDRRAHRHERPGLDADRPGLGDRDADGDRRFRRQGAGQADQPHRRRPPAQARHRRRHRAALVRRRAGRPDRRRAGVGGRPCRAEHRQREEEAVHHAFDAGRGLPRQVLLALRDAVGDRHPFARGRHRAGGGEARRRQLVLHHRRLCLRPLAGTRRHRR